MKSEQHRQTKQYPKTTNKAENMCFPVLIPGFLRVSAGVTPVIVHVLKSTIERPHVRFCTHLQEAWSYLKGPCHCIVDA